MKPYQLRPRSRPYSLHLLLFVVAFGVLLLGLGPLPRDASYLIASPLFVASGVAALFGKRSLPLAGSAAVLIRKDPGVRGRDAEARLVGFLLIVIGLGVGIVTLVQLLA